MSTTKREFIEEIKLNLGPGSYIDANTSLEKKSFNKNYNYYIQGLENATN